MSESHRTRTLEEIREDALQCRKCSLCETRNSVVFGVGNPNAEVMFIGEAPGKQEDLGAEPFIGAAGKFLNQLLELAELKREDIYIANVLKCRPPSNRNPRADEIEVCTPYLREQVAAIDPDILVTLGNFATKFILKTDRGITSLRGRAYTTGKFYVLPTFHPAAALYDQTKVEIMQDDFLLLKRLLEVERQRKADRLAAQAAGTVPGCSGRDAGEEGAPAADGPSASSGRGDGAGGAGDAIAGSDDGSDRAPAPGVQGHLL